MTLTGTSTTGRPLHSLVRHLGWGGIFCRKGIVVSQQLAQAVEQSAYKDQVNQSGLSKDVSVSQACSLFPREWEGFEQKPYEIASVVAEKPPGTHSPVQIIHWGQSRFKGKRLNSIPPKAYHIASTTGSTVTVRNSHRCSTALNGRVRMKKDD